MEESRFTSVYDYIDQQRRVERVGEVSELTYNQYTEVGSKSLSINNCELQANVAYQPNTKSKTAEPEINENDRTKEAVKKMSMILIISVIVNVVMLLLVTTVAIVGSIQSQSASGECTSADIESLKSQYSQLEAETRNNVSNIRSFLNETNGGILSMQTQIYCGPGEWRLVAYLNMSDPTQQCPSAWREYNTGGVRACGRPDANGGSCPATTYSIDFHYRKVCGRALAYQFGSPDAFYEEGIDEGYVDGLSITHGSPRKHIWTYAAGLAEGGISRDNCPCSRNPGTNATIFVKDNYYCESANPGNVGRNNFLFLDDKLWDGQQCEDSCCTGVNTPPWFRTNLPMTTNDAIEVRICGSESTLNENILLTVLEMYVQ